MMRWGLLGLAVCVAAAAALVRTPGPLAPRDGAPAVASPPPSVVAVTAVGHLEPRHGLIRLAGPSQPSVVIAELLVEEGDPVGAGQILALLDTVEILEAHVSRLEAELANARAELDRKLELHRGNVLSDSQRDAWQLKVVVAEAELRRARAELERARVRSPIPGTVIEIHAREGERVGPEGICELGRTDEMYAIAEVYETDAGKVEVGQRATVTSPALPQPLHGTVERVGLKVGRLETLDTDPAARTDARVVEVEVRLDESAPADRFMNLQVEISIEL